MFFTATWRDVINRRKTETRRIVTDRMSLVTLPSGQRAIVQRTRDGKTRIKWQVGHTYGVQPKRGRPSIARIEVTGLRIEPLHAITDDGARAEGVDDTCPSCEGMGGQMVGDELWWPCEKCGGSGTVSLREGFKFLWETVHGVGAWDENPEVAVVQFKVVKVMESEK